LRFLDFGVFFLSSTLLHSLRRQIFLDVVSFVFCCPCARHRFETQSSILMNLTFQTSALFGPFPTDGQSQCSRASRKFFLTTPPHPPSGQTLLKTYFPPIFFSTRRLDGMVTTGDLCPSHFPAFKSFKASFFTRGPTFHEASHSPSTPILPLFFPISSLPTLADKVNLSSILF